MLDWLYNIVAWVLIHIHSGLTFIGFAPDSGWAWGLSIVTLTILMRLLMVPLFVKQMHTQRKMQDIQPQIMKLREKYKNDKQRLQQEQMKIYQESGANPVMGCLPLLLQMPIFFALFNVLRTVAQGEAKYGFSTELVESMRGAMIFHAPISAQFTSSAADLSQYDADPIIAKIVIAIACVLMGVTTFLSMRQGIKRSMTQMPDNPMMQSQKIMMYLAPAFGLFGLGMPVGVLIYWVSSNVWTMGQQHFLYKQHPVPGSPEAKKKEEKAAANGSANGSTQGLFGRSKNSDAPETVSKDGATPDGAEDSKIVRKQPKKQPRSKRVGSDEQNRR
ncbi:membrane protein insertase YidC [Salinactinospora qingdaonensis]|uniref:Membrane protein insertase YidC n=1 Tax=Salinactinospora qingdaonensis TaxID=702744 RepID=A0ABP7F9K5_9ACTN